MTRQTRRERRQAELEDRRQSRRRRRPAPRQRSLLLPVSIAAIALGVVAVAVFALMNAPPAAVELEDPITRTPYELADGRALGSEDAPVTMDIWSDFQCPACAVLATQLEPEVVQDYVATGELRIVYRDFAFLGPESTAASVGAYCAEQQDRFWQYHDYLFANQAGENRGGFTAQRLDAIAERVGLQMDDYRACRDSDAARQAIAAQSNEARAIPINSTPSLIVGDRLFTGVPQYAELRQAIDEELAAARAGQ
jgi:protein-disulfide isomerase